MVSLGHTARDLNIHKLIIALVTGDGFMKQSAPALVIHGIGDANGGQATLEATQM